jgi:hypothetical protein
MVNIGASAVHRHRQHSVSQSSAQTQADSAAASTDKPVSHHHTHHHAKSASNQDAPTGGVDGKTQFLATQGLKNSKTAQQSAKEHSENEVEADASGNAANGAHKCHGHKQNADNADTDNANGDNSAADTETVANADSSTDSIAPSADMISQLAKTFGIPLSTIQQILEMLGLDTGNPSTTTDGDTSTAPKPHASSTPPSGPTGYLDQASPEDRARYLKATGGDTTIANTLARVATDPQGKAVLDIALAKGTTYKVGDPPGNAVGNTSWGGGHAPIVTLTDPTNVGTVGHESAHAAFNASGKIVDMDALSDYPALVQKLQQNPKFLSNMGVTHEDVYKFGHTIDNFFTGQTVYHGLMGNTDVFNNKITNMLNGIGIAA